jgi:hypothetical protein
LPVVVQVAVMKVVAAVQVDIEKRPSRLPPIQFPSQLEVEESAPLTMLRQVETVAIVNSDP